MSSIESNNLLLITNNGMNYSLFSVGMSGQNLINNLNSNFSATDAQLQYFNDEIAIRIISSNIKEIKVENDNVVYTTDGTNWISLQPVWGNITGDISKQKDLYQVLGNKVNLDVFNKLQDTVLNNKSEINNLSISLNTLTSNVSNISSIVSGPDGVVIRLNKVESDLSSKVSSSQVKAFRTNDGTSLEFTTDNETWIPVSNSSTIEWGNITGDIANQGDLIVKLNAINSNINTLNSNYQDISNQIESLNSQVDELSDTFSGISSVKYLTETEYNNLYENSPQSLNDNTIYIVSSV